MEKELENQRKSSEQALMENQAEAQQIQQEIQEIDITDQQLQQTGQILETEHSEIENEIQHCYMYDTLSAPARIVAFLCGVFAIGIFELTWSWIFVNLFL